MKEFFANKKNWLYVGMGAAGLALLVGMIILLLNLSGNSNTPILPSNTGSVAPITLSPSTEENNTQASTEEASPLETATLAPVILVPLKEAETQEEGGNNNADPAPATQTRAYYSAPAGTYSPIRGYNRLPATTVHFRDNKQPSQWVQPDPTQSLESSTADNTDIEETTAPSETSNVETAPVNPPESETTPTEPVTTPTEPETTPTEPETTPTEPETTPTEPVTAPTEPATTPTEPETTPTEPAAPSSEGTP